MEVLDAALDEEDLLDSSDSCTMISMWARPMGNSFESGPLAKRPVEEQQEVRVDTEGVTVNSYCGSELRPPHEAAR